MAPSIVHLPDGQTFTVQPVFSGLFFKSNDLNAHPTPFPAGWTVVLHSEDNLDNSDIDGGDGGGDTREGSEEDSSAGGHHSPINKRTNHIHKYSQPTLQNDTVFISSISNPSSSDYRPPASASRQIALMVWITLYWYFQQPPPPPHLPSTPRSRLTPAPARPKGEWRIRVKREGVLRTRNMIPKLERMGLIATMESGVGTGTDEAHQGWDGMFVTKSMFWQIPPGLFLFTLQPMTGSTRATSSRPGSPAGSRPTSPIRGGESSPSPKYNKQHHHHHHQHHHLPSTGSMLSVDAQSSSGVVAVPGLPIGPYFSPSGLPTYYPPPPLQYTLTHNIRHPIRRKPPRMGEIFYSQFVPSVGQYLSFRVASLSPKPVPNLGPIGPDAGDGGNGHLCVLDDTSLLQMWLAKPRVSAFWGTYHATFLSDALSSRNSFPVIGLWDGVPFGYFEIYWVKEDPLGRFMGSGGGGGGGAQDFDRGLHVLVGEEWARGRVQQWLSGLVHWCWLVENRTMNIYLEPRVDNERFIQHLQKAGFSKDREIAFPHKQACLCRLPRDTWEGPAL